MNRPALRRSIIDSVFDRRPFKVGGATIDPVSRDARWQGGQERLQPQIFKVLITLMSRSGEVVTRDELIHLCWDGRIVGDDVINRSILIIRHFAERAGGFEIETVPRTGYRLVETTVRSRSKRRGFAISLSAALLVVLTTVGVGLHLRSESRPEQSAALTIGLLPFVADSPDAQTAKLAATTREAVANTLAQGAYAVRAIDDVPKSERPKVDFLISARTAGTDLRLIASRTAFGSC